MVPDGWEFKSLTDLAYSIQNGFVGKVSEHYVKDGVPYLMAKNIRYNRITIDDLETVTLEFQQNNPKVSVKAGDILTVQSGHIGTSAIVPPELDNSCCHALIITKPIQDKIDSHFIAYYLNSPPGRERLSEIFIGTTIKHINTKDLKKFYVPVPPLSEQKKIAEILSSVDEAIASTQAVIDQTRQVKQGLLQQLLTGGIGHTRFKESAIGKIPETWNLATIKELVLDEPNSLTAGPFGTIFKAKDFRDSGVPIIQIRHVTEDGFSWGSKVTYMDESVYEQFHRPYTVKSGDLLITKMGEPPGIACIYPKKEPFAMVTPDVIKASVDHQKIDTYFLMCLYNSPQIKSEILNLTKGGTRSRVTLDEFYKLLLPCPPLNEQIKISTVLFALDELIDREKNKLQNCEGIKRGLMQDLLTGRIRVRVMP
ncbi:restriction endonuclease subunit S [Nostoc sp. FACHB-888]|uniref:restriction endonuclease subunit S n=1 Tax=Nostoc sp. FACHB-888 TaxID=2692842 RepID=UPI001682486A|nr:restriction endonuclease subunit S [Nostoc sp. FACHB-888]MBD2246538.1 restriction endonuclease subunit S [Nostoc sp. FACHB-888]